MPLTGSEKILAASMYQMVSLELGPPPNPEASKQLKALCAGLANAIVPHILTAQVAVGIPTAGSPAAQVTTGPGVLI